MIRTMREWIHLHNQEQARFVHDGNPQRPHPIFTSGLHSDTYMKSKIILANSAYRREAAQDLLELFVQSGYDLSEIDGVVGPATGATKLAEDLAYLIQKRTGRPCFWASPFRTVIAGKRVMIFSLTQEKLLRSKHVLLCEDTITTGLSISLATDAIKEEGGICLPYILAVTNRSGLTNIEGRKVFALIDDDMPSWPADVCHLCKLGSTALRPNEGDNWSLLTADYERN